RRPTRSTLCPYTTLFRSKTSFADEQFFVGRGAGAHPTASAVLSDISALTYDYRYEYKKIARGEKAELATRLDLEVFLRHDKQDRSEEARLNSSHVKISYA